MQRSCSTRNSLTCSANGIDSISSRKTVPPLACSNLPMRRSTAPVKAPFSWPKSSDSMMLSGTAPQLMATKGEPPRGLRSWMARATRSLPVPVSPNSKTSASTCEMRWTMEARRCRAGVRPTRRGPGAACWASSSALSCRFSRLRRRLSMPRRTISTRRSPAKGFSRKSQAPSRMASTAVEISPWPVISMTGRSGSRACTSRSSAMPSIPGMRISLTMTPGKSGVSACSALAALAKGSGW